MHPAWKRYYDAVAAGWEQSGPERAYHFPGTVVQGDFCLSPLGRGFTLTEALAIGGGSVIVTGDVQVQRKLTEFGLVSVDPPDASLSLNPLAPSLTLAPSLSLAPRA